MVVTNVRLTAWAPEGRKRRNQAGPKGPKPARVGGPGLVVRGPVGPVGPVGPGVRAVGLEVGAQWAPRLLVCYILKSLRFKDIQFQYDIPVYQMGNTQIRKYKVNRRPNMCYIFENVGLKNIKYDILEYQMWNTQIHKYTN